MICIENIIVESSVSIREETPPLSRSEKRLALRALHNKLGVTDKDSSFDRTDTMAPSGPEDGSPLYDVCKYGTYPEDIYTYNGLHYYNTGEPSMDARAYSIIRNSEARPNYPLKVYRAIDLKSPTKILPGDWVTTVRQYAKEHGEGNIQDGFKIISKTVMARDIFTSGDSWLEWGYHPQTFKPELPRTRPLKTSLEESASLDSSFWKWFGDSKVVDEQGSPLVLFHGTPMYGYFDKFKKGKRGLLGPGIYFTDDYQSASGYSKKAGSGGIYKVYLKMSNPLIIQGGEGTDTLLKAIYKTDSVFKRRSAKQGMLSFIIETKDIRKLLDAGYDGIIWKNQSFNEYVVYYNDQIRKVIEKDSNIPIKKIKSFTTEEGNFSVWDIDKDHKRADMFTVWENPQGWIIRNALVPEDVQKQGIATDFYIKMNDLSKKETKLPLRSSQPRQLSTGAVVHELSSLGEKLWESLVRKGYAIKKGKKDYVFN